MKYYVCEHQFEGFHAKTAFSKARLDAERICEADGFRPLSLRADETDYIHANALKKLAGHWTRRNAWADMLSGLTAGDTLFLQMPVLYNSMLLGGVLQRLRKNGVHIIALLHDLELIRLCMLEDFDRKRKFRMRAEEEALLAACDRIIVHNGRMAELLAAHGIDRQRMVLLEIFDYLADGAPAGGGDDSERGLIVAGNLTPEKAGYIYTAPEDVRLELYGVNFAGAERENLRYHGAFAPEELPDRLRGGFGLVWDGPDADTCRGTYGEYLRYNNPHKTSLYLASGLPVAIWDEAAMAGFITREQAGITAGSLREASEIARSMSPEEYRRLCENACRIGRELRRGAYLRRALTEKE